MANIIYKLNVALVSMQLEDNAHQENVFKPFFYCTFIINILIIFFTQSFQGKINDLMVRISPSTKGTRFNPFF